MYSGGVTVLASELGLEFYDRILEYEEWRVGSGN